MSFKGLQRRKNREGCFNTETIKEMDMIYKLFLVEKNRCLASLCGCLQVRCNEDDGRYNILIRPSSVEHEDCCYECCVDMPTGTLHVNTEITIGLNFPGPNKCSLAFKWTSKTKSLSAPDKWLLGEPQPISSLPIYVDFLPALESLKSTSSIARDEHDFFIVPKHCNACDDEYNDDNYKYRWWKSWCMAEINAFTKDMSAKHRRCYQIMKYLSDLKRVDNYHVKTVALRHHTACSDTADDCVNCVMRMFTDLLLAYETKELLSYQSNLNILSRHDVDVIASAKQRCEFLLNLCSVSVNDTWDTFICRTSMSEYSPSRRESIFRTL